MAVNEQITEMAIAILIYPTYGIKATLLRTFNDENCSALIVELALRS